MNDQQLGRKIQSSGIPVISPLLHVISMPALLILRHNFGYQFLRPKCVLLALCWAMLLFAAYSFIDPQIWNRHPWFFGFLGIAVLLYVLNLIRSIASQWGDAPHDQYAGKSWFAITGLSEEKIGVFLEPALVAAAAFLPLVKDATNPVENGFFYIATAMLLKASINSWERIRKLKQQLDATSDAETVMNKVSKRRDSHHADDVNKPTATSRKARAKRRRVE
ncbi:MAG: hypothetical protein P1V20_22570 [Verrucomicrobiales bacterium]|nr:hypothetical protein [Verrucomicrobiales bacterium]